MTRPKYSEATILSVAKTTLASGRSTVATLAEFGITAISLDAFEADIGQAEALPREANQRVQLRYLTHYKDDALFVCEQWGKKLRMRLELAFGRGSHELGTFPAKQFNAAESSENAMMSVMPLLIELADKHQAVLADHGQTPEILAQGPTVLADLRTADAAQEVRKVEKLQATQARYELFLRLYDTITRINKVGRLVFRDDPVHLALFESKWPTSSAPEPDAEQTTMV